MSHPDSIAKAGVLVGELPVAPGCLSDSYRVFTQRILFHLLLPNGLKVSKSMKVCSIISWGLCSHRWDLNRDQL